MKGKIVSLAHESACLADNALSDPTAREVLAYLPPGYEEGPRLPTVMMLPGFAATHRSMLGFDPWKPNTAELFEGLIEAGTCRPAILVMPDAICRWGGSQFMDSAATGRYQSYLAEEVVPLVDRELRTIPKREARAVAGRSSGGFGALRLGMDRPELFSVLGSHAGDAAFEVSMRPMLTSAAIAYDQAGGFSAFAEQMSQRGPRGGTEFDGVFVLAASAAYGADGSKRLPYALPPFDLKTAEIIPELWEKWLLQDPLERAESSAEALRSMSCIFLDSGASDEHGLQFAARALAARFGELGATVVHEEYEGGHRGTSYRYESSLPTMIHALAVD